MANGNFPKLVRSLIDRGGRLTVGSANGKLHLIHSVLPLRMARAESEANYLWLRGDLFYLLKARDKYADAHPAPAGDPSARQQQIQISRQLLQCVPGSLTSALTSRPCVMFRIDTNTESPDNNGEVSSEDLFDRK